MARAFDPITSFQAADQAKAMAARHQQMILEALKKNGPMGKCGIADCLIGIDHIAVARRMTELERLGMVKATGTTKSDSGRNERVWATV